ncbi:MAG: histidine phosphatase family protein [Deltaproteobacteria bacterium]|nr:histidine phosphatase family protein [Deltaproteobacteria bacterium]MBW2072040.1 histidine phosphatase family protein [Deltaproteobacteria bacterium]
MRREQQTTEVVLLRHAETVWNREMRIQGQQDSMLTYEGRLHAMAWGRALRRHKWNHLVSSDLGRARQTAHLLNKSLGLSWSIEPRLRELDWGCWSGLRIVDLDPEELAVQQRRGWQFRPPGGESREELFLRSSMAVKDLCSEFEGGRLLVVTHGGVLKCLIYRALQRMFLPEEPPLLQPHRLHRLSCNAADIAVARLNEPIE